MTTNEMMEMRGIPVTYRTPCYISVDIETTGPTPGHYSMFELGACEIGSDEEFERHIALLPNGRFNTSALRAVGSTMKKLLTRNTTVSPATAMREFAKWVRRIACGDEIIFVANNAPFDWMFVAWYFEETGVVNPFGHSALDMKAYGMGRARSSWKSATLEVMAREANIPFTQLPHRALADAKIQAEIFSNLMKR